MLLQCLNQAAGTRVVCQALDREIEKYAIRAGCVQVVDHAGVAISLPRPIADLLLRQIVDAYNDHLAARIVFAHLVPRDPENVIQRLTEFRDPEQQARHQRPDEQDAHRAGRSLAVTSGDGLHVVTSS